MFFKNVPYVSDEEEEKSVNSFFYVCFCQRQQPETYCKNTHTYNIRVLVHRIFIVGLHLPTAHHSKAPYFCSLIRHCLLWEELVVVWDK